MILTCLSLHIECFHDSPLPSSLSLLAYGATLNHSKSLHIDQLMHSLLVLLHDTDELLVRPDLSIPKFSIF